MYHKLDKDSKISLLVSVAAFGVLYLAAGVFVYTMTGAAGSNLVLYWLDFFYGANQVPVSLLVFVTIVVLVLPVLVFFIYRHTHRFDLYGNSHFMSLGELRRAGLLQQRGLLLGRKRGRYVCVGGQVGAIVVAPPRSGKGIGPIICNMLNFNGSIFCVDIRGETYDATSGFRKKHGQVFRISPLEPSGRTHCFNPFDFLSEERAIRISQVQTISNILIPTPEKVDPMWSSEARDILEGVILFLYSVQNGRVTIGQVARFFKASSDFAEMLQSLVDKYGEQVDPFSVEAFQGFLQKADKEQSGVTSTVKSALKVFLNPQVEACTSRSDFDPKGMRSRRITVYLNISPDHIKLLQTFLSFLTQSLFFSLISRLPDKKKEPYQVLAILDEFPAMGRLDAVKEGMGYFAGYNVVPMLLCQDTSQLYDLYGEHGGTALLSSMVRIYYACNNEKTAQSVSVQCGNRTARSVSRSSSVTFRTARNDMGTINRSQTKVPLITPEEIMQLPADEQIILVERHYPVRCKKLNFLVDSAFSKRVLPPAALPPVAEIEDPGLAVLRELEEQKVDEYVGTFLVDNFGEDLEEPGSGETVNDEAANDDMADDEPGSGETADEAIAAEEPVAQEV